MGKIQQANDYLQLKQQTERDVRQLGVLAGEKYEADSTANQTVINLNFSVTQTAEQKRGFQLYVDGQLLREGAANDFQFTSISGGTSAQVTLNSSIAAGLNIVAYKIGGYSDPFPSPSSIQATLLNDVAQPHKMALAGFQPFVVKALTVAPNTVIQNRALVESGALKSIFGVERIPFKGISLLKFEVGPLGERVSELSNGDSRVRFIGNWNLTSDASGARPVAGSIGDSVEFTYYGTGLNVLWYGSENTTTNTISIDGSALTALNSPSYNNFGGRNYTINQVYNLANNQTLGWHTIRMVNVAGMGFQGMEILNERSNLATLPGIAYGGTKQETLASTATVALNAGVVGTRGARVVKYIQNNAISQSVQEVNASAAYSTSADHTNEEVVRRLNFLEFGANRGDDFSTISGTTTRAFTLDDGSTTLTGSNVQAITAGAFTGLSFAAVGQFITITFTGTGLDVTSVHNGVGTEPNPYSIYVDGVLNGTMSPTGRGSGSYNIEKIVSGLPYGTHTVKLQQNTANQTVWSRYIMDFIVYQPKKPSIPSGAIELSDYNVVANYVAASSGANGFIGTGVIRKNALRELGAVGSWSAPSIDPVNFECGFNHNVAGVGGYVEYFFYGTGIIFTGSYATGQVQNSLITVDGASNLSAFSTSIVQGGSGVTFTPSTGAIGGTASGNNIMRIQINGLTLGYHRIRVTQNTASGQLYVNGFDVITPIHINTSNLRVGSMSLNDRRAFSPLLDKPNVADLANVKSWLVYDGVNSRILSSFNVSAVLKLSTGRYNIYFEKPFKNKFYSAVSTATDDPELNAYVTQIRNKNPNFVSYGSFVSNTLSQTDTIANVICTGELEDEGEI